MASWSHSRMGDPAATPVGRNLAPPSHYSVFCLLSPDFSAALTDYKCRPLRLRPTNVGRSLPYPFPCPCPSPKAG
jgi:hypothetical protein